MELWDLPAATAAGIPPTRSERHDGRAGYDVLVLDAGTRQSLACTRSLGRAGLRIALGECFAEYDPALPVLSFRSRHSAHNAVFPSFATDAPAFADAVLAFVTEHPTRTVLPASDGSIAALIPRRGELAALGCRLALPPTEALTVANSKQHTLDVARNLGIDHPPTLLLESPDDIPAMLREFRFPLVLKPASSWVHASMQRLQVAEVVNEVEAIRTARAFLAAGSLVLAQEWVGGRREGVTLFMADGEVTAAFAHLEHRTTPATGGASVVRESIALPEDINRASVQLVTAIGLEGLSEVEFRRDTAGRPYLMEINARLAGPIETALNCGVDFPLMVWQWTTGGPIEPVDSYLTGLRMRWVRGDMRWLRDNWSRVGRPDSMSRTRAMWTFLTEFARTPRVDCFDRRDLGPLLAEVLVTAAAVRNSRATAAKRFSTLDYEGAAGVR